MHSRKHSYDPTTRKNAALRRLLLALVIVRRDKILLLKMELLQVLLLL